jgi:hypothetical protein
LSPANNYTPEILICGGSTVSDSIDPLLISSQTPASSQCIRMVLNAAGITAGWKVEQMPEGRVMVDMILLPDGRVMLVNGYVVSLIFLLNDMNRFSIARKQGWLATETCVNCMIILSDTHIQMALSVSR